MQAECVFPAFDNQTSIHYPLGPVIDFDETNEKLNSLTVPGSNRYVFRYPGHEFAPEAPKLKAIPPAGAK